MNSIGSFTGLASGIQWADLIDQILELETARQLGPVTNQVKAQEARQVQWSAYEALLVKFNSAATALKSGSAFKSFNTTVTTSPSGKSILSASASAEAAPGSYQVEVIALARADKLSSASVSSTTDALGLSGEFYVNGRKVELVTTDSLASARDKINAVNSGSDASGVTATILSTSSTEYRLILTADKTGRRGIELSDGDSGVLQSLGVLGASSSQNVDPTDSSRSQTQRFSSSTTALASMLGVTAPPAVTTILIDGQKVSVDLQNDTLLSIMNRVNAASGSASLTEEEVAGKTLQRLTVDGAVTADGTATDTAASQRIVELLGFVQNERSSEITTGRDSVFRIDGFKLSRRTNTVSDAVTGLTLNLLTADTTGRSSSVSGAGLSITTDPLSISPGTYTVAMTHSTSRSTSTSDPSLEVLSAPGTTSAGTYAVNITTAASVAQTTGAGFDGTYEKLFGSDTLTVTDGSGNGGSVTLSNNTTLATIVADLNTAFTASGATLLASDEGGQLRITSTTSVGSASEFMVSSDNADVATNLGIADGTYNGSDVAGTIGGVAATGSGYVLTGSGGAVDGLQVEYTGTTTGSPIGTVTVTDTDSVDSVTIDGVAATWDSATSTITGATGSEFDGLVLGYSGAPTTDDIGTFTVEGEIAATVSVSRNLDSAVSQVQAFADAYNNLVEHFNSQRGDPNAPLYANGSLRSMQRSLTQALLSPVEGLSATNSYTRGAVAGVALDSDGNLDVDAATLRSALEKNLNDVRALFSTSGTASNGQISFVAGTDATEAGTYAVEITTAATQATHLSAVWGGAYAASDGVSDTLTITDSYSGSSVDFVVTNGMTLSEAVTELTELFETEGMDITAEVEGGALRLRTGEYGSESTFTLAGAEASTRMGLTAGTYAGVDVAGTIDGVPGTGEGRVLTGANGEDTEGLAIMYTGTMTGSMGTMSYVLGISGTMSRTIGPMIRSGDGTIANQLTSIEASIERLNKRADDVEARLAVRRATLEMQYLRMEQALGLFNSQGQWLTQQIQALTPSQS